jgi:hypothetical protein
MCVSWQAGSSAPALLVLLPSLPCHPATPAYDRRVCRSAAVTHGHPVGALHRLLQAHPNAKVAAHSDELPFLVGHPPHLYSNATEQLFSMRVADALGWVGG